MNFKENLEKEPMKYWAEPKTGTYTSSVLANPEKFPQYLFTPKKDGEWNKMAWDGEHMYMLSRARGVDGTFADRCDKVPHITEALKKVLPLNTIFLGELALEDVSKTSKHVGSVMRSLTPRALDLQKLDENKLHFFIFDCLMWDGIDCSGIEYQNRFVNKYDLFKELGSQFVHVLEPKPITELNDFLSDYFKQGGEGVVLVDKTSKYEFGSRKSKVTVKIKKQLEDFEALVVGFIEPNKMYEGKEISTWQYWMQRVDLMNGGPYGWSPVLGNHYEDSVDYPHIYIPVTKPYFNNWKNGVICSYKGRSFSVTSGLDDNDRAWLATESAELAIMSGQLIAVVSGMELTTDSVRHPYLVRLRCD